MRRLAPALAFIVVAAACRGPGPQPNDAGPPVDIDRERSLVWIHPDIVDNPAIIGLARVMATIADDGHGGRHLHDWFDTFATTAHSERLGPALLMEELRGQLGADPTTWDLDALPFIVTAVHNRIDLGPRAGECGELRVSLASTHPIYAPLHLIFLFRQPRVPTDTECRAAAARWASLSAMSHTEFVGEARAIIDEVFTKPNFLIAESVELTVSPWEWRQWDGVVNLPLFQTVDSERLNQAGALRDDFVQFATTNAAALTARTMEVPERFRPLSARVPPGVPRVSLDLQVTGYPDLAAEIEIMGCPACHTENADFVQTTAQRTFSDFYDAELDARAIWLDRLNRGEDVGVPPFGPLQAR